MEGNETNLPYEVLDLSLHGVEATDLCRKTMKLLASAKRIIVVAGAGISVAAGIPDFRSSAGLFSTLKADTKYKPSGKELFDVSVYKSEKGIESYNEMISSLHELTTAANPTAFHAFLDQLSPRLLRVYTQNIDSLENRFESLRTNVPLPTKAPWPKTIQLHGDLNYAACFKCRWVGRLNPEQLLPGAEMGCGECRVADDVRQVVGKRTQGIGIIRPRVVLYNEPNPDADAIGAVSNADIRSRPPPDLVIVVGTSLKIPGTKRIVRETINAVHHTPRGKAVWINLDPPPSKDFDIWIKGDCQRIPELFKGFEVAEERAKEMKVEETKRKEELKLKAVEEREEKKARDQLRKEESQRLREHRKEERKLQRIEREQKAEERKARKAAKEAEKARRELERAIRPMKQKPKKKEDSWSQPPTPPLTYDTDSTLSSPSLSDIEFASIVESGHQPFVPQTPSKPRFIEYLPTPDPTPQKHSDERHVQDSPLKSKKRKLQHPYEMNNKVNNGDEVYEHKNSMSIRFLMDSD